METVTNQIKKITEEELSSIKELQQEFQQVQSELGEIEISKSMLEKRKSEVLTHLTNLQSQELELTQKLNETYGKIELNLENGEYSVVG